MYRHILVPLDGSPLAERAIATADGIARASGASVTLLHVIERRPPRRVHGQTHLADPDEAQAYLDRVAAEAFSSGVRVARHVHREASDRLADSLAWHGEELEADLVVMYAHGSVRLRDRVLGNLAQQIMTRRVIPVLLVHPDADNVVRFPYRRLLLPLDGQPAHEPSLAPAADLAAAFDAELMLLAAVPAAGGRRTGPAEALFPSAARAMVELNEDASARYLESLLTGLHARGIRAGGRVVRGEPGRVILQTASDLRSDLIVLSTHGKAGTHAFWSGSLAPRLLRRAKCSFLLVPAGE